MRGPTTGGRKYGKAKRGQEGGAPTGNNNESQTRVSADWPHTWRGTKR